MNQILLVQEKRNNHSVDTKKIVLFFSVFIIVFGAILTGEGAYLIYQSIANKPVGPIPTAPSTATINFTQTEDDKVLISVESTVAVSHIIYNWNTDSAQTIDESGKTTIKEEINIPAGENILNLSVIDTNGIETKKTETFVLEISKPVITLSVVGDDIKISVTSEVDLSYVTYKWNSDAEKRQDMDTYENKTEYEKIIEIPKGQNTLKITAVDTAGNQTDKSQEIRGVTKAKTTTIANNEYIEFTVKADENIKSVEFEFNGKRYIMTQETFGQTNTVHYKVKLANGMNYLKITSTTQSDAVDTTTWKYEYYEYKAR